MTLGLAPRQGDLWRTTVSLCDGRLGESSIYSVLHRECFRLFPDEMFADLFTGVGRRSVPPMIVAVVMVLQRIEGCSDREAVDRFTFDARWKYAAGGLDFDFPGFSHTVLVDMRARLAASERPDRIFEVTLAAAKTAGLIGRKRVLDSTPLYDAVATMDTVTLVRSAIRNLLKAAADDGGQGLVDELGALLCGDDDYVCAGKPVCDYDDAAARAQIVDRLARDGFAVLAGLQGRQLGAGLSQAAVLLATVIGQDLDQNADGVFFIARRVAKDRVISVVDPQTRHGRKSSAHGFDGYKGHIAIDPDSEIITETVVTAGNTGDGASALDLLAKDLANTPGAPGDLAAAGTDPGRCGGPEDTPDAPPAEGGPSAAGDGRDEEDCSEGPLTVYGDAAYGRGESLEDFAAAGLANRCKVPSASAANGLFSKDEFTIDQEAGTVTCPNGQTAVLKLAGKSKGMAARFGAVCAACPLAAACTKARDGRTIRVGPHEALLAYERARQQDRQWIADYRATRPKVERKIGHLMKRKHGGRRARMRGQTKIAADFSLLAAAVNLARLGVLGYASPATI